MGPWPNDPLGPQARASADIYWIMFVCAIIVLAIVDGALIYAGLRFRDRPGHIAKQFHGHNMLELVWTVVPTIMVISFSVLSFQKLNVMNDTSGAGMTIDVQGQQWSWVFNYPKEDRFKLRDGSYLVVGQELHIPVGTKVHLKLSSKDVIHSFWVPNIGGKKDAVPGRATDLWIQADKPGTYKGACYEFCGTGHADMLITLVVHTPDEYASWATSAVAEANRLNDPATQKGRETFLSLPCAGCHTVKGTTASGKVGPELTNVASKKSIAGGAVTPVNEDTLSRWIKNPQALKPSTTMPNLGLSDEQVHDIVQWLLTLK
ncbi:MAG TPA: cytochrome c oxidase subunit II [Candidatus Limnocylindria bacterium]|nr:cytochrome c oxidase subunit II [Candidatus Limnocylindria bacterium]